MRTPTGDKPPSYMAALTGKLRGVLLPANARIDGLTRASIIGQHHIVANLPARYCTGRKTVVDHDKCHIVL